MAHVSSTRARLAMLATSLLGFSAAVWSAADSPAQTAANAPGGMSATQIADRNIVARGGLQAWRAVQTQTIAGHMDAGSGDSYARSVRAAGGTSGASVKQQRAAAAAAHGKSDTDQVQLPFRMELKRPNKSRLEIDFAGKTALQVYDGTNGWKVRPFLNRNDAEPFTDQEAKAQSTVEDMRGPLIDYAAQGTKLQLDGIEAVDGHDAYKLKLTTKQGDVRHVWVDTKSFLDVKVEGVPRKFDGRLRNVWIYQRDFRNVNGLMIPFTYETALEGVPQTHKMAFDSVKLNLPIDDGRFGKPQTPAPTSAAATKTVATAAH